MTDTPDAPDSSNATDAPEPEEDAAARDLAAGNAYWAAQREAQAAELTAQAVAAQASRALTITLP